MDLFLDNQFCSIGFYLYAITTLDFYQKAFAVQKTPTRKWVSCEKKKMKR